MNESLNQQINEMNAPQVGADTKMNSTDDP